MQTDPTPTVSTGEPQGLAGRPELARMVYLLSPRPMRRRLFIRMALSLAMIAATIAGWLAVRQIEDSHIHSAMAELRRTIETRWSETNLRDLQPVRTVCNELDSGQITTATAFVARAQAIRKNNDIYEALYWVSSDSTLLAGMTADDSSPEDVLPGDGDFTLFASLRRKAATDGPVTGPVYEGKFGRGLLLLYLPLGPNTHGGGVAAVIRIDRLMEHFADEKLRELAALDFVRDGHVIYRTGDYLVDRDPNLRLVSRLRIMDQIWLCQIVPSATLIRQYRTNISIFVLCAGTFGCLLAGGSILNALKRKWQHAILERGHLQVIEVISQLSRSISAQRGELQQSLKCLLESAQALAGCDVVAVYTFSADRRKLTLMSSYGDASLSSPVELNEAAIDALRPVMEGRLLPISHRDVSSLYALRIFESGDLNGGVIAPLQLDRVIGVMFFGSRQGEIWSEGQKSLARLWGSQCAALLEDETLHQQMREAISVQEKLSQRREMMLNLLGEILQAGSIDGTLTHIAQTAPQSLGVEACVVCLRTKRENELEIVAGTGELGVRYFGTRLALAGEQIVRMSRPGATVVIELADIHRYGFGRLAENWLGAVAVIPMTHSNGRPIGCLLLMSSNKSGFTDDQLELARVLASRASSAIETAQLNQQIRRDAESRAMLLRELNHRVKNNLAGIVGLLSMSSAMEMPDNVRRWLDRVTERIGNIARAHELFAGGISTVALAQLVEQVIPSLAVVKAPGVLIVKDFGERDILLKTSQAVSLAMIIHELCYNAIVHGLGARGTLTIRARQSPGKYVTLEIIDDGTAGAAGEPLADEDGSVATIAPPVMSTGLGLRLVKGLVGRELRGRFSMSRRSEGGTVVSVEFPLERDQDEGDVTR